MSIVTPGRREFDHGFTQPVYQCVDCRHHFARIQMRRLRFTGSILRSQEYRCASCHAAYWQAQERKAEWLAGPA